MIIENRTNHNMNKDIASSMIRVNISTPNVTNLNNLNPKSQL
jgi:hypothetical protein